MDYSTILSRAVDYANNDPRKPRTMTFAPPINTDKLELWYEPQELANAVQMSNSSEDEVLETVTQIVTDSVQKAIVDNSQLFVHNLLNDWRNGATGTNN